MYAYLFIPIINVGYSRGIHCVFWSLFPLSMCKIPRILIYIAQRLGDESPLADFGVYEPKEAFLRRLVLFLNNSTFHSPKKIIIPICRFPVLKRSGVRSKTGTPPSSPLSCLQEHWPVFWLVLLVLLLLLFIIVILYIYLLWYLLKTRSIFSNGPEKNQG